MFFIKRATEHSRCFCVVHPQRAPIMQIASMHKSPTGLMKGYFAPNNKQSGARKLKTPEMRSRLRSTDLRRFDNYRGQVLVEHQNVCTKLLNI
jgi:hypothetical protein